MITMIQKKHLTKELAFQKIRHYCAYQERSHYEVREKLYSMGLWKQEVEMLIAQLVEENYLNEERFARHFAGGKFRMKQWGRVKIRYDLKQKQVSEYCIKQALKEISDEDYSNTLNKVFEQKLRTVRAEKNIFIKKRKILEYLLQKGFERELATGLINDL